MLEDSAAQPQHPQVGGIGGGPVLKRPDRGLADMPGRHEIGFADAQADDALAFADHSKEVANAGAGHAAHMAGDEITG